MATDKTEGKIALHKRVYKSAKPVVIKVVDRVAQAVAAVFVLATSFLYVRDWLQHNQINHDFSLVGAIMVMSVALYLIVRKR